MLSQYSYYGLGVGDRLYFKFGKLFSYNFSDFNQNNLIDCDYDTSEKCKLRKYKAYAILTSRINGQSDSALGVFLLFPKPPKLKITQTLGLKNAKDETISKCLIPDNRLFLDTILSYPDRGCHYFISTHIEDLKDSIDKVIIQMLESN